MKKIQFFFLICLCLFLAVIITSTVSSSSTIDQPACQKGIKPTLKEISWKSGSSSFQFALRNITDHDITVTFPTMKEYGFVLTNEGGKIQKGDDHSFRSFLLRKRTIKQGKTLTYNLTFKKLDSGMYTLETHFLANGCQNLTSSFEFEILKKEP